MTTQNIKKRFLRGKKLQFKNAVVKTKNPIAAYQEIYPNASKETARQNSLTLLNQPIIYTAVSKSLNNIGLDISSLNVKLKNLLDSEKVIVTKDGVMYAPDNAARTENLKTAYKLHKVLGNDEKAKGNTFNDNRQVTFNVEDTKASLALCDRIDALNANLAATRARRANSEEV